MTCQECGNVLDGTGIVCRLCRALLDDELSNQNESEWTFVCEMPGCQGEDVWYDERRNLFLCRKHQD